MFAYGYKTTQLPAIVYYSNVMQASWNVGVNTIFVPMVLIMISTWDVIYSGCLNLFGSYS